MARAQAQIRASRPGTGCAAGCCCCRWWRGGLSRAVAFLGIPGCRCSVLAPARCYRRFSWPLLGMLNKGTLQRLLSAINRRRRMKLLMGLALVAYVACKWSARGGGGRLSFIQAGQKPALFPPPALGGRHTCYFLASRQRSTGAFAPKEERRTTPGVGGEGRGGGDIAIPGTYKRSQGRSRAEFPLQTSTQSRSSFCGERVFSVLSLERVFTHIVFPLKVYKNLQSKASNLQP